MNLSIVYMCAYIGIDGGVGVIIIFFWFFLFFFIFFIFFYFLFRVRVRVLVLVWWLFLFFFIFFGFWGFLESGVFWGTKSPSYISSAPVFGCFWYLRNLFSIFVFFGRPVWDPRPDTGSY